MRSLAFATGLVESSRCELMRVDLRQNRTSQVTAHLR